MMLLKGGLICTENRVQRGDVRIKGTKIAGIAGDISPEPGERTVNINGRLVLPGIIDSHTHFKLHSRGTVTADDFYQGGISAAFGGVTTVIDYADQSPESLLKGFEERKEETAREAVIDYSFHLTINNNYLPELHNRELPLLLEAGVSSLKIFTTYRNIYLLDNWKIKELFQAAGRAGLLITVHAEDDRIIARQRDAFQKKGETGVDYHPDIRPGRAEAAAIKALSRQARESRMPVYIVHLSSQEGYRELARARARGISLYAETTPHYLLLTREALTGEEGRLNLMTPPLREKADNRQLWVGIIKGLIRVVATDHCAFDREQKARGKDSLDILPGIPGVETLLPLLYTYGVVGKRISLSQLVRLLSTNPARIFGLYPGKGSLQIGTDADLVVYNPEPEWQLSAEVLHSAAGYTPYQGMGVKGKVEMTILRGRVITSGDTFSGQQGAGQFVKAGRSGIYTGEI